MLLVTRNIARRQLFTFRRTTKGPLGNMSTTGEFYNLSPIDGSGKPLPFESLKGKVILIVNTASNCGFTPQYLQLEAMYKKFKDQDFIVLGFPCNQFGHQEPGSDVEIQSFCTARYQTTFPIMKKIDVNGPKEDPVYKYLKSQKPGMLGLKGIKWNFEKFLVDRNGNVVERYPSLTNPSSIEPVIEQLLKETD
ncbi:Uncharacterized protein RNJ44_03972 [Nakaseomyces bracarensis]|uniref:Glutathione peroxidase n=1 Tax=Nakaseomyces bracarensis TaxID=273131 RepID=A0ABR4NYZ8_9SACH